MLCEATTDGEGLITTVGPGGRLHGGCLAPCCSNLVTLQVRTRIKVGIAKICARFQDPAGEPDEYRTQISTVNTRKAYDASTTPATLVRTCVETFAADCGAGLATSGDVVEGVECDDVSESPSQEPSDCLEHLLDPPADYAVFESSVTTYGGETVTIEQAKHAAIGAMGEAEWSDWADLVSIDQVNGSVEGGGLDFVLAESGVGGSPPENVFIAALTESQVRVLGSRPLSLTIASGTGELGALALSSVVVSPGAAHTFSVTPAVTEEQPMVWLRCVCPPHLAAL